MRKRFETLQKLTVIVNYQVNCMRKYNKLTESICCFTFIIT